MLSRAGLPHRTKRDLVTIKKLCNRGSIYGAQPVGVWIVRREKVGGAVTSSGNRGA